MVNVIGSAMGASDGEEGRSGASLDDIVGVFRKECGELCGVWRGIGS